MRNNNHDPEPVIHPQAASRNPQSFLLGWLPALFALAALAGRVFFIATLGLFPLHSKRQTVALALQLALCFVLASLARRRFFTRLTQAGPALRALAPLAPLAAAAGWIAASGLLLDAPDLVYDTAWTLPLAALLLAALRPRAPWPQLALSLVSIGLLIAGSEWALGLRDILRARAPQLPDYQDVCQSYPQHPLGEAGIIRPNQNLMVRTSFGPRRWLTNSRGFRSEREFSPAPAPGVLRVLYVGDSFTAGYRTGQACFSGAVLERTLNGALTTATAGRFTRAEVLVAGTEATLQAAWYLQQYGLAWRPQLVVHGVCLGNDVSQAFIMGRPGSYYETAVTSAGTVVRERAGGWLGAGDARQLDGLLPRDAFRAGGVPLERVADLLGRRYAQSKLGLALGALPVFARQPITLASAGDGKFQLHLFDLSHGLADCLEPAPPVVEAAYACEVEALGALRDVCRQGGAGLLVALFPQRYAASDAEWRLAVRAYALDARRFDPAEPARRLTTACAAAKILCADMTPPLRAHQDETCYLPRGDMHWNDRGHEIVGRALAERVLKLAAAQE